MSNNDENTEFEKLALINAHRLQKAQKTLGKQGTALKTLQNRQQQQKQELDELDTLLLEADNLIDELETNNVSLADLDLQELLDLDSENTSSYDLLEVPQFEQLEIIDFNKEDSLESLFAKHSQYALKHNVDLNRSLTKLLSHEDLSRLNKLIEEELTYKNAQCDKYDYMIAGTAGVLGGLIDILFVGAPKEGILTKMADEAVDKSVIKFASFCGWKGDPNKPNAIASALRDLEKRFKVNYDQATGKATNDLLDMSTKNHHIKNLGHWPDLIGLFFAILDQFTNSSTFISDGRILRMNTKTFNLEGFNFPAKIFAGFCNWFGHIMSDIAGSSGAKERGMGVPIPFYGLFQFLNFGEFQDGKSKKTFADICIQVFEEGYDFRHGLAMAVPVMVTELIIRIMYTVKQVFYHKKSFQDSLPSGNIPEVRRMLLVGHGTLCLMDAGDAALRSDKNMVAFLLRTNLIGWVRFGSLAYKELIAYMQEGKIDPEKIDAYVEKEYQKMLL